MNQRIEKKPLLWCFLGSGEDKAARVPKRALAQSCPALPAKIEGTDYGKRSGEDKLS